MIFLLSANALVQAVTNESVPGYCRYSNISGNEAALLVAEAIRAGDLFLIKGETYNARITKALDLELSEKSQTVDIRFLYTLMAGDQIIAYHDGVGEGIKFMRIRFEKVKEIERDFQIESIEVRFPAKGGRDL